MIPTVLPIRALSQEDFGEWSRAADEALQDGRKQAALKPLQDQVLPGDVFWSPLYGSAIGKPIEA